MACDHDWTIQFLGVNNGEPFEVRPVEMNLNQSRQEYDFCRAKLPWEVGQEIKPHTRYEGGAMYGYTPVDVCYNSTPIQRLVVRPDWIDYGSDFTHLQLHDLQKTLADGVVDMQRESAKLGDIYEEIVKASPNDIISEIRFLVPEEMEIRGIGTFNAEHFPNWRIKQLDGLRSDVKRITNPNKINKIEASRTKTLLDSYYAIDFDEISPENAIQRLNQKYRLRSWVNPQGQLVVGNPEAHMMRHIAAPRDDRVWRYKDPNISHSREPIKKVVVWGAWQDEPGIDLNSGWFDKGGTADVRAMGIAERTDIDSGSRFTVKNTKAKKDALPGVAESVLRDRMKRQNSGSVEIDPDLSGNEISDVASLIPGDLLHLVPDDNFFDNPGANSGEVGDGPVRSDEVCGEFVNNEAYVTTGVQHQVTNNGEWQVHADLGMYPDVEINSFMSYFDPKDEVWVKSSEIGEDGELKGEGIMNFSGGIFEGI